MITAYFTNIDSLPNDRMFNKMLDKMDINSKNRIIKYKLRHDQLLRLSGRLLLHKLLYTYNFNGNLSVSDLKYLPSGKPYFNSDFNFSIAHSGNLVVCVGGLSMKIGVDTEKENELEINNMQDHFTVREWAAITKADTNGIFYKTWVRKEACSKATDKGVLVPLNEIDVCDDIVMIDDSKWYVHDLHIKDGYATCIVTDKKNTRIDIKEIDFDTLINQ